jgi:hypothetical protein
MSEYVLTEYGTTTCPVEGVRADVDDGACSACGASVTAPAAWEDEKAALEREHEHEMEKTLALMEAAIDQRDAYRARLDKVRKALNKYDIVPDASDHRFIGDDLALDLRAALDDEATS